jgi:hypothetical protein
MPDIKADLGGRPRFSVNSFYLALAALIVVVCALKLVYLERWLVDNDNYATLGTFFNASAWPGYVTGARRFYEKSVASCDPRDKHCIAYSGAIHGSQTYTRPFIAFFGSFLAKEKWLANDRQFLEGITKATVAHVVVSTALVVSLLLLLLFSLPRSLSAYVAGMTALLGVAVYALPEAAAFSGFQPLLGIGLGGALAAAILALVIWLYARTAGGSLHVPSEVLSTKQTIYFLWASALTIFAIRIIAAGFPTLYFGGQIFGSRVGIFVLLLSLAGAAVFLAAIGLAARRERIAASVIWISVFLLFGFVAIGEGFFTTTFHIAPRGHIYLLAAPMLIYIALRPNGWAIWLLPALALFHVSVAGLLCGCILATEIVCCLRRKSVSLALLISAVVLIAAAIHTAMTSGNPVVSVSAESLASLVSHLSLFSFLPGLAIGAVLLYAGSIAWRMPDPPGDFFLRAIVLAALLAGAGQLRVALENAGYDLLDPVAFTFILLSYYLAPIVCAAGTFLVIVGFATSARGFNVTDFRLDTKTLAVVAAGILALVAARGGNSIGRPANSFVAIAEGAQRVARQNAPSVDPRVIEAAAPNDRYLVGPFPGDAITMMSILKMKARAVAGLLKPDDVTVDVVKRRGQ